MSDENQANVELSLPEMVRLVGHELRNRIGVLSNSVYYLSLRLKGADERVLRHLELLNLEIANANRILVNLMEWAKAKPPAPERLNLNVLMEQILDRNPAPSGIHVETHLTPEVPLVFADITHVEQALTNLVAYEYTLLQPEGTLHIAVKPLEESVCLSLQDSAPPFSLEHVETLFSLLPNGHFSAWNMGLILARRLLSMNGCVLQVGHTPDVPWRFRVILPVFPVETRETNSV